MATNVQCERACFFKVPIITRSTRHRRKARARGERTSRLPGQLWVLSKAKMNFTPSGLHHQRGKDDGEDGLNFISLNHSA